MKTRLRNVDLNALLIGAVISLIFAGMIALALHFGYGNVGFGIAFLYTLLTLLFAVGGYALNKKDREKYTQKAGVEQETSRAEVWKNMSSFCKGFAGTTALVVVGALCIKQVL